MSLFNKGNASPKQLTKYKAGTTTGAEVSLTAVTGKRIYLESLMGFADVATIIEVRNDLTGTLATTNTDATVTGTSTLFTTELVVGDTIRIGVTNEILEVLSITSNTSLEATTNSGFSQATTASERIIGEYKLAAAGNIAIPVGGAFYSSVGRGLDVKILTSTADCAITASGYSL